MTDRDVLPFPTDDADDREIYDREIAERVAALYAQTPAADDAQIDRCVRGVLAESMHAPTRERVGLRPRWWWGAAAAAALVVVVARPWRSTAVVSLADSTGTIAAILQGSVTQDGGDGVRFDLQLPTTAKEVALVGDFNDWNESATPMAQRASGGAWSANVPLSPGRHVYAFVVDGKKWLVDPLAPQVPDDGLGPANAVVIEGAPK
jgi:hypothetical protein